mmetsp:Transcript_7324/g.12290  ORF Transcript_7324/g.12290 Transcript_7324/m.12290 type:complete len:317 (-) Transcript_7324:547-1497(-)
MISVAIAETKARSCETTRTVGLYIFVAELPSFSRDSNQITPFKSKWLVGSSRSSTSAWAMRAAASSTRMRHPPDNVRTSASMRFSLNPNSCSILKQRSRAAPLVAEMLSNSSSTSPNRSAIANSSNPSLLLSSASGSFSPPSTSVLQLPAAKAASNVSLSISNCNRRFLQAPITNVSKEDIRAASPTGGLGSCAKYDTVRCWGNPGSAPAAMRLKRVDLPTPLRPSNAYRRPPTNRKEVLDNNSFPAKARVTPSTMTSLPPVPPRYRRATPRPPKPRPPQEFPDATHSCHAEAKLSVSSRLCWRAASACHSSRVWS